MIKKVLKWVAAGLALSVATLLFLYLNRSDPYAIIPGKQLIGEEVAGPIDDWSFVQQYRTVTNEVRPSDPYSVNTGYIFHDGVVYVISGRGGESRWAQFLLQDPNMRIRVGDKLYKVRATRVEDPELVSEFHRMRNARNPDSEDRTPEDLAREARAWFFRIDSR
jgi:hypothetical protein